MEYDFSNIKTEELREAFDYAVSEPGTCGFRGLSCNDCPIDFCNNMTNAKIISTIEEELNRREKMENKMPELKAGMVVEKIWDDIGTHLYLVLGNGSWGSCLTRQGYSGPICEGGEITKLFTANEPCSIYDLKYIENLKLIWSKKSDKDIKIEELERTIKKAQEQIQELKG